MPKARATALWALLGILGIAALLRFVQLGRDSVWVDEAFSASIAGSGWSDLFDQATSADPNPPLYYAILHVWMSLFGDSETALRSLSAVVGVLLVLVVYGLGRNLGGREVGLIAALFAAVSEFFVHYSQEARVYSLLALLAAGSYYFLLRSLDGMRWNVVLGYILVTTALLYAHTYGLFVLAAQFGFALVAIVWRRGWIPWADRRDFALMLGVPLLLAAPWFVVFAGKARAEVQGSSEAKLSWLDPPTLHDIPGALSGYAGSRWAALLVFMVLVAAASVAWRGRIDEMLRRALDDRDVVLLLLWLVVPIAVPFLISLTVTPIYQFKYTIPAAIAFYLLVALGLDGLRPRLVGPAAVAIALVFLVTTVGYYDNHTEDWRQTAALVSARAEPGDVVVFDSSVGKTAFDYYATRPDLSEVIGSDFSGLTDADLAAVRTATADPHAVWLVISHSRDEQGEIPELLSESRQKVEDIQLNGVRIERFE